MCGQARRTEPCIAAYGRFLPMLDRICIYGVYVYNTCFTNRSRCLKDPERCERFTVYKYIRAVAGQRSSPDLCFVTTSV